MVVIYWEAMGSWRFTGRVSQSTFSVVAVAGSPGQLCTYLSTYLLPLPTYMGMETRSMGTCLSRSEAQNEVIVTIRRQWRAGADTRVRRRVDDWTERDWKTVGLETKWPRCGLGTVTGRARKAKPLSQGSTMGFCGAESLFLGGWAGVVLVLQMAPSLAARIADPLCL